MACFNYSQFALLIEHLRKEGKNQTLHFINVNRAGNVEVNPFHFNPNMPSDVFLNIVDSKAYRVSNLFDDVYVYSWTSTHGDNSVFAASPTKEFTGSALIMKFRNNCRYGLSSGDIIKVWEHLAFNPFLFFFVDWAII